MAQPSSPQRKRILDAAVAILAQKGQGGLTVRAVALESGFSTSGIYTWFGGKDGLLEAVYSEGFASFRTFIASADGESDVHTRMLRSADLYWQWAMAHPTHYLLMFAGVPGLFAPSHEEAVAAGLAYSDLVARVEAWRPADPEPNDTAHHIWATLHGYTMLQLAGPPTERQLAFERYQGGVQRLLAV
jgi:AcrR family transcriptional regulator